MIRTISGLRPAAARLLAALALLLGLAAAAAAQDQAAPGAALDQARAQLDQIEATLKRDNLDDRTLSDMRDQIEPLSVAIGQAVTALAPQLASADARLEQIGPKPADGAPAESPDVVKERDAQTAARQKIDEQIKRGRLLQVEASQVSDEITQRRRFLLAQRLFERSRSLLDPGLYMDMIAQAPRDIRSIQLFASDVVGVVARSLSAASIALALTSAAIALVLLIPGRRLITTLGHRLVVEQMPKTRIRRSATGVLFVLASTLGPVLGVLALYWGLKGAGWLPARAETLAVAFVWAAGFLGLAYGLMRAFLTPSRPSWRLVDLSDAAVAEIKNQPMWCALIFVIGRLLDHFNEMIVASLSASIVVNGVFAVLNAGAFALALRRIRAAEKIEAADSAEKDERLGSLFFSLLRIVAWVAVAVILAAAAAGYVSLAQFLANQVIWIATVMSLLTLLLIFVDDLCTSGLSAETRFGRSASEAVGIRPAALEQIGVLLSGLVRVILIGVAALFVLAPWGLETTDVFVWLRLGVTGFQVGGITISLSGILGAILLVAIGFALTKAVQRWLDRDLLPKTRMDAGLKASINTGVGYLGGLGVIVLAVSNLGFSLDRLAIVAGALSVGIGFGLQAVISNFVSGVILLAERPIKAGDWIVIGSDQGNVRRISVRSTEIELFDRSTLIVPNSDFITKSVKNVTHGAPIGRVQIELTVAADVDPVEVKRILLEVAKKHSSVLAFPEPQVFFNLLGKSDNVYALFANVASPRQASSVKSDLNFALVKAFKDQGVAIGGAAGPSMVEAVDRLGEALRSGMSPAALAAQAEAPRRHDASDAPLAETPPAEPQSPPSTKA
ncbi:small-conductance mechanosensitive channel [Methylopila capsulata]|uniref:Small-conductance mechanosensitive channel n=1 Tax=Methylopila capsulata TaxID=61654 RepID=A0A9W6ISS1_9HYPH|nr:DUF3772 domain-containing protein [Methylopila capsulata]MBM7851624.1 small-conductance mechanosensitive channel [Methylopila capsulata]GLK54684.1 hypothetical protein GCM10008170_07030 [Methylopila capsulata]